MASSFEVKLSSFLHQKGRRSSSSTWRTHGEYTSAKTKPDTVCIGLEWMKTSNISLNHAQHANITTHRNHNSHSSQHQPQNTHGNSLVLTTFTLIGVNTWLSWTTTPRCLMSEESLHLNAMPPRPSQFLKELLEEYGIPEVLHTDNGPQFANALLTKFATDWKFDHNTSLPRSNGQAEAAIKIVKGLLTHAKCSGQDPYLALLAYHSMPINAYLHSPGEMLIQQVSNVIPASAMHHCATTDQAHWPTCWCWTWWPQPMCHPKNTMTSKAAARNLHSLMAKQYLSSMMPGTCGSLPPSSTKPIMVPTWSKSLVVDSTDMLMTTFKNISQMLSNQTHPTFAI